MTAGSLLLVNGRARAEGVRRAHAPASDGTVRDTAYYSITAAECPGVRQGLQRRLDRGPEQPPSQ